MFRSKRKQFACRQLGAGTDSINAKYSGNRRKVKAPVIVQFFNGGASFIAGKGVKTDVPGRGNSALSLARITFIDGWNIMVFRLSWHTDHTARRNCCRGSTVCWTRVKNTAATGKPLFSHMIDPSEESRTKTSKSAPNTGAYVQNWHDPEIESGLHRW